MNYKFTFKSEKITNLDITSIFNQFSDFTSREFIEYTADSIYKSDIDITATKFIIKLLNGHLVRVHSEHEQKKVTINLSLPFITGKILLNIPMIHISNTSIQETLTIKWKPEDLPISHQNSDIIEPISELQDESLMPGSQSEFINKLSISTENSQEFNIQQRNLGFASEFSNDDIQQENISENLNINYKYTDCHEAQENINPPSSKKSILIIGNDVIGTVKDENELKSRWIVKIANTAIDGKLLYLSFFRYCAIFEAIFINIDCDGSIDLINFIRENESEYYQKSFICAITNKVLADIDCEMLKANQKRITYIVKQPVSILDYEKTINTIN